MKSYAAAALTLAVLLASCAWEQGAPPTPSEVEAWNQVEAASYEIDFIFRTTMALVESVYFPSCGGSISPRQRTVSR